MVSVIEPEIIARRTVRDLEALEQAALRPVRRANTMLRDAAMKAIHTGNMKLDFVELAKSKLLPALAHAMALAHLIGSKGSSPEVAFSNDAWTDVKHVLRKATKLHVKDLQARYGVSAAKTLREAVEKIDAKIKGSLLEISMQPETRAKAMKLLSGALDSAGVSDKSASQLETIFRTAMYQAASAGRYEADKQFGDEIWGYTYITMGDDRVRDEHIPLHGVVLPKEDPFWQSYWPPNGWNCRCQAVPLFTQRRIKKPKSLPTLDDEFDVPPGIITLSWSEDDHPREPSGSDKGGEFTKKEKGMVSIEPVKFGNDKYANDTAWRDYEEGLKKFPELTEDTVHSLIGAPDDADITVEVNDRQAHIEARGEHPGAGTYRIGRILRVNTTTGEKTCYNDYFMCAKSHSGFGTKVFAKQVAELSALGYTEIETSAERSVRMNGYYTWPRLGYDTTLNYSYSDDSDIFKYARKHKLTRVSDFLKDKEHREWWKQNGDTIRNVRFSLKEDSLSRKVLNAYLSEKGIKLAWNEEDHPRDEQGKFRDKYDAILASVKHWTHYSEQQLREGLATDMVMRARVAGSILLSGLSVKDAAQDVALSDEEHVKKITTGDPAKSLIEFAEIPAYDLAVLTKIIQYDKPLSGEARCYMATRQIDCGSTTRPGSYRHELGHAVRAALGGEKHNGRTTMTKAVSSEFDKVLARVKAKPDGMKLKKPHEWYETEYGVAGRRSLDNWEENFAEHYRLYHRELYRDRHEGKGHVAAYRERHPGWAKIWDAHYTTALLAEKLKEESLSWDEDEHPREPAGDSDGGEFTNKRITIAYADEDDAKAMAKRLGFKSLSEVIAATGSEDDYTSARITMDAAYGRLTISIKHNDYTMEREFIATSDGEKFVYNNGFEVAEGARGQGLGTEIFTRQVNALAKRGYSYIATTAVRSSEQNGFYTWARFGYDAELQLDKDSKSFGRRRMSIYALQKGFTKVSDFMKKPEDREWWRTNGVSFDGTFDLKENSQSRRVLDAYNAAKKEPVAAAWSEEDHPREPGGSDKGGEFTSKVSTALTKKLAKLESQKQNLNYGKLGHEAFYAKEEALDAEIDALKEKLKSSLKIKADDALEKTSAEDLGLVPSKDGKDHKAALLESKRDATPAQLEAIGWWTHKVGASTRLEFPAEVAAIRGAESGDHFYREAEHKAMAKQFNKVLDQMPKYEGTVYRGLSLEEASSGFQAIRPGKVFKSDASDSATKDPYVAIGYGNVVLRVKSKTGADIDHLEKTANSEVVMRKGTRYLVTKVNEPQMVTFKRSKRDTFKGSGKTLTKRIVLVDIEEI